MKDPSSLQQLLSQMGRVGVPVDWIEIAPPRDKELVSRIEDAIASGARSRRSKARRKKWLAGIAVAALAPAVALAATALRSTKATDASERGEAKTAAHAPGTSQEQHAEVVERVEVAMPSSTPATPFVPAPVGAPAPLAPGPAHRGPPDEGARASNSKARSDARLDRDLFEQNELFARALRKRRDGDHAEALRLLRDLLSRHPDAPMAHEARVEELRALRHLGDRQAAERAARRYLTRHPDGFAATEARSVLGPAVD